MSALLARRPCPRGGPRSRARSLAAALTALAACGAPGTGSGPADTGGDDVPEPLSPPVIVEAATLSPVRTRARAADDYLVNYGSWDASSIAIAQQHQLVVVNPNRADLTRAQIAAIQGGTDPADPSKRVIVACYVSIGEDLRTVGRTDAELAADPRFVGDGSGPRMDPRGPDADGQPLTGLDPLGLPSNGGTGFASYYLDDASIDASPDRVGDGLPDRNGNFHGAFVNVGDPAWFAALEDMTYQDDHAAGLREALTTTYGRGLGCDGVFLDTLDTVAPNAWTTPASSNPTKFEWTAPGYASFLERLRAAYPDIVVIQNRGLFFFNPWNPHYAFIPRGQLDFVMFESYRLNSGATDNPDPYFYPDNRFNFAPKLVAEAGRADGFRVLSLGYAEGPADQMSEGTLTGASTLGRDSLLEDIRVTEREAGFRHYLTDATVTLVNRFVHDHADRTDGDAPVWTSTYNDHWHHPELQRSGEVNTSAVYEHVYTSTDPASPYLGPYVENDGARVYFHARITQPFSYRHVFIDDDASAATGYAIGGIGAGFMIENGSLYRWVGPGWAWTRVGSANQVVSGDSHDWSVARADVNAAIGAPRIAVVFQANGGSPTYVAPVMQHAFTP